MLVWHFQLINVLAKQFCANSQNEQNDRVLDCIQRSTQTITCINRISMPNGIRHFGEIGVMFSLHLWFARIKNKTVIAENQCDKHKNQASCYV